MANFKVKLKEAEAVVSKCATNNGFYASAGRYKYEYWTRDFAHSLDTLLELGYSELVKNHLIQIWKRQNGEGEAPTLVISNRMAWRRKKLKRARETGKIPFMLEHQENIEFLFNQWTKDSTPLLLISTRKYTDYAHNKAFWDSKRNEIKKAVNYVDSVTKNGFLLGSDWRDTMTHLQDKAILSNQVVLYEMNKAVGREDEAEKLKKKINAVFWNGNYYVDFKGSKNFDVFGSSLAVLSGIIPQSRYDSTVLQLRESTSKYGMRNILIRDPGVEEKIVESCDQFSTIWPFVAGYAILALIKMQRDRFAESELAKLTALEGFSEWYDATRGEAKGSRDQLWSAALYLRAFNVLHRK